MLYCIIVLIINIKQNTKNQKHFAEITFMRETILYGLKEGLWCVWNWFISLVELPLTISPAYIWGSLIACVIMLASAAWAGNIAENKGRYPHLHIFLALILPFIYPLIISFVLKALEGSPEAVRKGNKAKREHAAARREAQIAAEEQAIADQLQREEADPTLWSKSRMERIAYNADGSAAGPFICTLSDGQQIRVVAIQGLQENVAVFELAGAEPGVRGPVMRFPYERIHGMEVEKQV